MADIALDVIDWSTDLQKLGYPRELWESMVDSYEKRALETVAKYTTSERAWGPEGIIVAKLEERRTSFERQLAVSLNAYRSKVGNRVVEVVPSDSSSGCGGGNPGVDFLVSIRPPEGQVFVISFFKYDVCREQGHDPLDRLRCDFWEEARDGSTIEIAGKNHYRAQWSDGASVEGTISDKDRQPFIIRKPKR
jgi:hypothetical protein